MCEKVNFPSRSLLHILLIIGISFLAYSNTFNDPFQWDDNYYIKQNPAVKDLSYFLDPSKAKGLDFHDAIKSRYLGYLTFAINYQINGLDVTGYHVFNFIVHILNSILVYFMVLLIFRTPFLRGHDLHEHAGYIAFFTGLLFATHPVQTEAVTYIFQRLASLATFFSLLSIVLYLRWRLGSAYSVPSDEAASAGFLHFWRRNLLYILSIISAVSAMKTKENTFTLPILIALIEFLFFTGRTKKKFLRLLPFFLTLPIIPLTLTGIQRPVGEIIGNIEPVTRGYTGISRLDYMATELTVIATYIRLLFIPVNQNLDYDYPVHHSLFESEVLVSFMFFISVLGLAVYLYHRSRLKSPESRLIAFGIFWFFITLSVESSMIPLPTLIDEYRVYLPSAGFFLSTMTGAFLFLGKIKWRLLQRVVIWTVIAVPLVFSAASYARNNVWHSRVSLWEDVVKKSPLKARPHNNLGNAYWSTGMVDEAIEHYRTALRLMPDFPEAEYNLGVALETKNNKDDAIEHYLMALSLEPRYGNARFNLGLIYLERGDKAGAREQFEMALSAAPSNSRAREFLQRLN